MFLTDEEIMQIYKAALVARRRLQSDLQALSSELLKRAGALRSEIERMEMEMMMFGGGGGASETFQLKATMNDQHKMAIDSVLFPLEERLEGFIAQLIEDKKGIYRREAVAREQLKSVPDVLKLKGIEK